MTDLGSSSSDQALLDRLATHLDERASSTRLRPASLARVEERMIRRRRRHRIAATASGTTLAMTALVVASVWWTTPQPTLEPAEPGVEAPAPSHAVDDVPPSTDPSSSAVSDPSAGTVVGAVDDAGSAAIRWEVREADTDDGMWSESGSGTSNLRLSTDPTDPAVFVTDDGLRWQRIDLDPGLAPFAAVGSLDDLRVVLVNEETTPRSLEFGVFRDGAWRFRPIPVELTDTSPLGGSSIAAVGGTTVFSISIDLRFRAFRIAGDEPSAEITDDLVDAEPRLGDPAPLVRSTNDGFVVFSPVPTPAGALGPDGASWLTENWAMSVSDDGLRWRDGGDVPWQPCCPVRWRGHWLTVDDDLGLQHSADGEIWEPISLSETSELWQVLPSSIVVDDIVTVVTTRPAAPVQLSLSENGVTMRFDQTMQVLEVFDDATGEQIGSTAESGTGGLIELDMDAPPTLRVFAVDGSIRAEFTVEEASAVVAAAPATAPDLVILQSSDLETWTTTDLASLVGGVPVTAEVIGSFDGQIVYRIQDRDGTWTTILGTPVP